MNNAYNPILTIIYPGVPESYKFYSYFPKIILYRPMLVSKAGYDMYKGNNGIIGYYT